jgi:outer membrane translocation and assembly module TamA
MNLAWLFDSITQNFHIMSANTLFRTSGAFSRCGVKGLLLCLLFSACNVTKHLDSEKGERLLVKNTLTIKAVKKLRVSEKTALSYELSPYYRQKPNRKSFGFFYTRLWLHYRYKDRSSGFARWINKRVAEPPAIYDDGLAYRTALNFRNQMRQSGYFHAECTYEAKTVGKKKAKATYKLELGPRFTIRDVAFDSRDTMVADMMRRTAGESLLKKGGPLDARTFEAEKLRIAAMLKDRGFAYFIPQFVEFSGDSSGTKANVTVEALPFNDSTGHRRYFIGKVDVLSGVVPDFSAARNDTVIGGVHFAAAEPRLWVKPSLLRKKILLEPGTLYQQSNFDQTLRNLNTLGVYGFVSIRPLQDSLSTDQINVTVNLSPNRRFSYGGELDLNYSRNSISNGLLGLSPIYRLQNRNLFSGAEHLQSSLSYNIEFDITNPRLIFAQEFKFQNEMLFPRFFDYMGFWKLANRVRLGKRRLVPSPFYSRMRSDGEARLSANYNYLNVTAFYSYHLSNVSFGYKVRSHPEHQYTWDHIGVDVLRPRFDSLSASGEFLRRSFANQLFTGLLMRSFNYSYNSRANRFGERWSFRFGAELSGLEVLAAHRALSALKGTRQPAWQLGDLEFAQFLRLDQEVVYTRNFSKEFAGAVRIGAGMATTFGDTKAMPYVKQFFVGGPSSLRAWRIRELGPGGFVPRDEENNPVPPKTQPFYQAGDFRFEFGGELRFPLFLWFKGAVFVDGGNIWTLRNDETRPGSQLSLGSYKNIAIGTGLGLRMDVDYFVLRLDFGVPLRRPYADANGKGYWVKNLLSRPVFNPNLAVGYPF